MPHCIRCPSGLTGAVRGLTVREERIHADRKLQRSGGIVDGLLRAFRNPLGLRKITQPPDDAPRRG